MGYERNDRRFDGGRSYGYRPRDNERRPEFRPRDNEADRYGRARSDADRAPSDYDYDERGFFDRAGDEVRSWFGDEEAERRRRFDERYDERYGRTYARDGDLDRARYYAAAGDLGLGGLYYPDLYRDSRPQHDRSYREWRDRQMASYDRDYDAYRQENQTRFDSDFGSWRQARQGKREALARVQEHQEVVGSDGQHIGKVDKVHGERILLTRSDPNAGGHHHSIPLSWIETVDEKVHVSKTADQAIAHWRDEERNGGRALWDRGETRDGPHYLNRSFAGTY